MVPVQLREKRLKAARTILGMALGKAPKAKLFKFYIDLETQLAQVDRVRTLYSKFVEWDSTHVAAWIMFANLEASLQETERARAIFELALGQPVLNQPERLWMEFIDFEIAQGERDNARALYERLLERTQHVKVRPPTVAGVHALYRHTPSNASSALCERLLERAPHVKGPLPPPRSNSASCDHAGRCVQACV